MYYLKIFRHSSFAYIKQKGKKERKKLGHELKFNILFSTSEHNIRNMECRN